MIIVPLLIRPVFIRICGKLPDLMVLLNIMFQIPLIYRPSYAGTVLNPSTAERITSICLRRIRSTDWGSFR